MPPRWDPHAWRPPESQVKSLGALPHRMPHKRSADKQLEAAVKRARYLGAKHESECQTIQAILEGRWSELTVEQVLNAIGRLEATVRQDEPARLPLRPGLVQRGPDGEPAPSSTSASSPTFSSTGTSSSSSAGTTS